MPLPETDRTKYPLLQRYADDIRKLEPGALPFFCEEVRRFLVDNVSKTGGHLASNLGVVELTAAVHRVFDVSKDNIVFDVGHQCYVHKMLTGRIAEFETLRKKGGLSGYPRPAESPRDSFIAGHASNAISVALGMARAAKIRGGREFSVAIVGDGAAGGGMAYEGMNDAGGSGEKLIVILNDNGMSIDKSVGALAGLLTDFRMKRNYRDAKKTYHRVIGSIPGGDALNKILSGVKNNVKQAILPGVFFESMGFEYIGPVDGHDVLKLCAVLESARTFDMPVLIHAVTEKGKGYKFSENRPEAFHGTPPFDIGSGKCAADGCDSFTSAFGSAMVELAEKNKNVVALTAAMPKGTGLLPFSRLFKDRFFDVGIAEGHAAALAAGMAARGLKPYLAVYSTFLQRTYDQMLHDVGILGLPVVFCADRAGLVGEDGETHQGLYDMAMLSAVPRMQVFMPSNEEEMRAAVTITSSLSGPSAIRYSKGAMAAFKDNTFGSNCVLVRPGRRATVVASGRLIDAALEAASAFDSVAVVKLNRVFPLDPGELLPLLSGPVLVCEELAPAGSVYMGLSALLSDRPHHRVYGLNCGSRFVPHATMEEQLAMLGLDAEGIKARLKELLR